MRKSLFVSQLSYYRQYFNKSPYRKAIKARKTTKPSLFIFALLVTTAASPDNLFDLKPDENHVNKIGHIEVWICFYLVSCAQSL